MVELPRDTSPENSLVSERGNKSEGGGKIHVKKNLFE